MREWLDALQLGPERPSPRGRADGCRPSSEGGVPPHGQTDQP
jgi:hypothetical protein